MGAAGFVGGVIGFLAACAAIDRGTEIYYLDLSLIFLSWLVVFGVAAGLAFTFLVWVFRGLPRRALISHATGAANYLGLARIFLSWLVAVSAATGLVHMLLVYAPP
jgi:hypothetical protein